jgi:non-homologous end joining protein Ku
MAAKSTWTGALSVAGFPFHVKVYNAVKSTRNESFKTLCKCHGEPIAQRNTCATTGAVLDETAKGVPHGQGFKALPDETIEAIKGAGKSVVLEPLGFPPLASVPLFLSTGGYRLIADPKTAGSAMPVASLYQVLKRTGRAMVTTVVLRAGSPDQLFVVYADDRGLVANTLPWFVELTGVTTDNTPQLEVPEAQVAVFEQAITTLYDAGDFDLATHVSTYKARREEAVTKALAGEAIDQPADAPAMQAPDLMAALTASLQNIDDKEPIAA